MCIRLLPGFTDFGFGKFPTNANNTIGSLYPLPILGKFLQTSTTNSFYPFWESSCKCQPEISVHFKTDSFQITGRAKQKKTVDVCCPSFLLKWRREQFPSMRRWHLFPYRNPEIEGWHTKQRPMCFHKFSHNSLELFFQDTFYYIF